jgi:hypothetical protein
MTPLYIVECLYCGDKFKKYIHAPSSLQGMQCRVCRDSNFSLTEISDVDVFGYGKTTASEDAYIKGRQKKNNDDY